MPLINNKKIAVWAITPGGLKTAVKIQKALPKASLVLSRSLKKTPENALSFNRLKDAMDKYFLQYEAHVFVMATGIVVRMIAPFLHSKIKDPAVVVMDESGLYAISLVSGHIGGANALALKIAEKTGATPVITTATDINKLPAIDVIAKEKNLYIENPQVIKDVSMALLTGKKIFADDPYNILGDSLPSWCITPEKQKNTPGVYIGDEIVDLSPHVLILRPKSLVAGMGCNRGTKTREMKELLFASFEKYGLCLKSLYAISTIDIKKDEHGLLRLAKSIGLPLLFFSREELKRVENIKTPSETVKKHMGVQSVCEAAAILGAENGNLVVPKNKTKNVTLAVARKPFT